MTHHVPHPRVWVCVSRELGGTWNRQTCSRHSDTAHRSLKKCLDPPIKRPLALLLNFSATSLLSWSLLVLEALFPWLPHDSIFLVFPLLLWTRLLCLFSELLLSTQQADVGVLRIQSQALISQLTQIFLPGHSLTQYDFWLSSICRQHTHLYATSSLL